MTNKSGGQQSEPRTGGTAGAASSNNSYPLAKLLLDANNPRFGVRGNTSDQADILDRIVEQFGVDDVLSSIAVNGYFVAEPLVCRMEPGSDLATVAEGNRRLAACLILAGDPRASRHPKRTEQFRRIWQEHGSKKIDPVPVIIVGAGEQQQQLLSYLGVRHITPAQAWDSFAKAAWVAQVVESSELTVADIALMIGDQHRTIDRLLEGFYVMAQLEEAGIFRPEDSIRRGRGSVTAYPFSWVYTILGYSSARRFLGLEDAPPQRDPIKPENLSKATMVVKAMFGDRSKGRNAAIEDSRQLGDLASAVTVPEKASLLEEGRSLVEIQRLTRPIEQRFQEGLQEVRRIQTDLLSGIIEHPLSAIAAEPLLDPASRNRRSATELEKQIRDAVYGSPDDSGP